MNAHLVEIEKALASGAHAVHVMDGVGRHGSGALRIPDDTTIVTLPPNALEPNRVGNIWAYLRANRLAITVSDIVDRPWPRSRPPQASADRQTVRRTQIPRSCHGPGLPCLARISGGTRQA